MLLPADHILQALSRETTRLSGSADSTLDGSSAQSVAMALNLLDARERGGVAAVHAQCDKLDVALQAAAALLPASAPGIDLQPLQERLASIRHQDNLQSLEGEWRQLLFAVEKVIVALNAHADIATPLRSRMAQVLAGWESADLRAQIAVAATSGDGNTRDGNTRDDIASDDIASDELTASRWCAYLQRRFDDPQIRVTSFRALPGGFGKQTFLFEVEGQKISGGYVIRRDMAEPTVDNDCHRIDREYKLIRAMHARGFPAPDAVWLDSEHPELPGGDFLVMRRAPGTSGGSFFGAQQEIPADLAQTLATILARLHALEPMPELDGLTDSINLTLWKAPLAHCVRSYFENWLALFQSGSHLPSPAIVSQFGWLLDHIPPATGKPVLLHGDIGFHNFLFDERRLAAVLDWEFAHLGDPAEDLAYVRNSIGAGLDWEAFLASYRAAGGVEVDPQRLHFFQIWGHLRNACAGNMAAAKFADKYVNDLKMVLLPHAHIPQFLSAAQALIDAYH